MPATTDHVKFRVNLPPEAVFGGESMWAISLGDGRLQVDSTPFFAYDLSLGDIIRCDADGDFVGVVEPGENGTIRIILGEEATAERIRDLIATVQEWGASAAESGFGILIAMTVPGGAFAAVCAKLEELAQAGEISAWEVGAEPAAAR